MPRRKNTRKNQTSRKRPMLPEGDLDTSMSIDERKAKLDVYLKDLNMQVEERIEKMKARGYDMICKVKGAFSLEILKLPMSIRKTKLNDYLAQGGEVNDTALTEASKVVSEMTRAIFQTAPDVAARGPLTELGNLPLKTPTGLKVKNGDQTTEPEFLEPTTACRSLRSRKRKDASPSATDKGTRSAKSRKTKDNGSMMAPPSTGKRTSKRVQSKAQFVTPAARAVAYSNTPMVTPKFDPRLPLTPALLREPKAGERIMSLSGSPIVNHGPTPNAQVFIPLGNGRTFHLNTTSHLSPSQPAVLNEAARKNVELLQQKLAQLLVLPTPAQNK
ncbi:borealin-like isoform X2 [Oculina patagonica]